MPWLPVSLPCVVLAVLALALPELTGHALIGALVAAATSTAIAAAAWRCAAWALPSASFSQFAVAFALLAQAMMSVVVALTGSVGQFHVPGVLLATAIVHSLSRLLVPAERTRLRVPEAGESRVDRLVFVFAGLSLAGAWVFVVRNQLVYVPQDADSMMYHLPMAGEWVRTASIRPIDELPLVTVGYPGFRQSIVAFLSLPFGNAGVACLGVLEFPLLAASLYVLLRSWSVPRPVCAVAGVGAVTTPVVLGALSTQGNDLALAIHGTLAIAFMDLLLRPRRPDPTRPGAAILAGVALGALVATKHSGIVYAGTIVTLAIAAHGCGALRSVRTTAHVVCGIALVAGPWYVRNAVAFGNPLYPARLSLGGVTVFDGPLGPEWFARESIGWSLQPLLDDAQQFVEAHGPLVVLHLLAPLLVVARTLALGESWRQALAILALPVVVFLVFLPHPFNVPSFDASQTHRFLVLWHCTSIAATAYAVATTRWPAVLWSAAVLASAFAAIATKTRLAWPIAAGAMVATGIVLRRASRGRGLRLPRWRGSCWSALAATGGIAAVAFGLHHFRSARQYHPDYGYHDPVSERGWGGVCKYVLRNVRASRVGLHGSIYVHPLLGDPWSNEVFVADELLADSPRLDAAAVAAWVEANRLDWLVCCVRRSRSGSRAFTFGTSIAAELMQLHPDRFTIVFTEHGAHVLRVRRDAGK